MQPLARVLTIVVLALNGVAAQAPPPKTSTPQTPAAPAQTPKPAPTAPAAPARPAPVRKPAPTQVIVRNVSGMALAGVKVVVTGPSTQEVTTDANGTVSLGVLADGVYRLRFEQDGFLTFEREVTVKAGQPSEIYAAMRIAPSAAPPPVPPPPPAPAPVPPVASVAPGGPPVFVSIPDYLDKNYIRREPLKESVLGCLGSSTTRLLQLHDGIADHTHADMDETLYIVAGEGAVKIRGEATAVSAGSLTIIPRGVPHGIERRSRNPLMVLSTLSGAPCRAEQPQVATTQKK